MARQKGSLSLSSNLEPRMASSLDARYIVEHDADLTDSNSWEYVYTGMQVYSRESQKVYILRYDNPTVSSSWVEIGTGKDGLDGKPIMVENTEKIGRENIITLVWTDIHGADHSTDVTILDGQAGPEGPEGPQGPAGQAFSLHSQYDSYEELIAEHPTGSEGEAYFVTSETPGAAPDVYVWLVDSSEWFNQGPITGIAGPRGADGVSPDVVVAENSEGVYKLRITTSTGSFVTPNLRGLDGDHAPQDKIDDSAEPVQSKTIKTALDAKQDKTLVSSVGVRNYETKNIVDQTTVQTTLEALAAAVNYMETPAQLLAPVATVGDLPANAKQGSICLVGEQGETPIAYVCTGSGTWEKVGGASDTVMEEFTANEVRNIWENAPATAGLQYVWSNVSFTGFPQNFSKSNVWSDGTNIYHSLDNTTKKLNKETREWETVSFSTSFTDFDGNNVWTDGDNVYYSDIYNQCVFNKSNSTWENKTWYGFEDSKFSGVFVWKDGDNVYYSEPSVGNKVLNKATSTWEDKTWNATGNIQVNKIKGACIWTDGNNIYYSSALSTYGNYKGQFVLDKATDTWSIKTWDNMDDFNYNKVWSDGKDIYCSDGISLQKKLNKTTQQWEDKVWEGAGGSIAYIVGTLMWSDGDHIYASDQYMLS